MPQEPVVIEPLESKDDLLIILTYTEWGAELAISKGNLFVFHYQFRQPNRVWRMQSFLLGATGERLKGDDGVLAISIEKLRFKLNIIHCDAKYWAYISPEQHKELNKAVSAVKFPTATSE